MKVSIIIPCFNAELYIAEAIGSVLEQTWLPHEIIVVDDGSTDSSRDIVASFHGKVQLVELPHGGASRARNQGVKIATGDAFMFLDADDLIAPDTISALVGGLKSHPSGIAMCPWNRLVFENEHWIRKPACCRPLRSGETYLAGWLKGWFYPCCSVLWSKKALIQVGEWDEKLIVNQDGDIMMRALALEIPVVMVSGGLSLYRRTPGNKNITSRRLTEECLSAKLDVIEKVAKLLEARNLLHLYRWHLGEAIHGIAFYCDPDNDKLISRCLSLERAYASLWNRAKLVLRLMLNKVRSFVRLRKGKR